MTVARASRYPVDTHWIVDSGDWRSSDRVSSATLTIVVSRIDMITPSTTTPATTQTSRGRGSPAGSPFLPFTSALLALTTVVVPTGPHRDSCGLRRGGDATFRRARPPGARARPPRDTRPGGGGRPSGTPSRAAGR